jgi:hypothetical protein
VRPQHLPVALDEVGFGDPVEAVSGRLRDAGGKEKRDERDVLDGDAPCGRSLAAARRSLIRY